MKNSWIIYVIFAEVMDVALFCFAIYSFKISWLLSIVLLLIWYGQFPTFQFLSFSKSHEEELHYKPVIVDKDCIAEKSLDKLDLVNKKGISISDLRPEGIVKIDNKQITVRASGYISKGTDILVTKVTSRRVYVKEYKE